MDQKRKDGFEGQKLISLPKSVYKNAQLDNPLLSQLFITHIGYFPKASYHYRERKKGCEDNILIYCLQGKGWFVIDQKKYIVKPNQFIHIPATTSIMRYGADEYDPWTIYWVHYSGKDMFTFNRSLKIKEHSGAQDITFNEKAVDIWNNMYQSLEMGYSRDNLCNANLCLYHFLATFFYPDRHLSANRHAEPGLINDTIHYMRLHLHERLNVGNLAALNNMSASHFSNLFRKSTGMPPIDYFIHLKMQKACQLLYSPTLKIKEIAYTIGYDDPYYFSRIFKKLMGLSPEQYRILQKE
jgi:AraC-like DNA-binding protein